MIEIAIYLSEFLLISTLFFVIYLLIKEHATPQLRRVFLLCWLLSSSIFPLISIEGYQYPVAYLSHDAFERKEVDHQFKAMDGLTPQNPPQISIPVQTSANQQVVPKAAPSKDKNFSYQSLFLILYFSIVGLLFARFLFGLAQILMMTKKAETIRIDGRKVFKVNQSGFTGASFFQWIFIGSDIDSSDTELILQHEMTHSRLRHSFDVILGNLYQIMFWACPWSWYVLRQIKLNAELETDHVLSQKVSIKRYGELLLNLHQTQVSYVLNNFSAGHLKVRIKSMTNQSSQKKWILAVPVLLITISFLAVSCSDIIESTASRNTESALDARLVDVKSITTKFVSHQNDTQQKTGKIVSRVTFLPDGSLDEFVEKTSYPYDREYEVKKTFWDTPAKKNLFHAMDGLNLGVAERNLLYGNDWSTAYLKHLRDKRNSELSRGFWDEEITADKEINPTSIKVARDYSGNSISFLNSPETTQFFEYDGNKVISTSKMTEYKIDESQIETYLTKYEGMESEVAKQLDWAKLNSGKVTNDIKFFFDGELLTSITTQDSYGDPITYKFFYQNNLLTKQEYYKYGKLVNTRVHHYKNGLKDRSEIFNIYNEPEYTILYEYEFW
ncbi:MAG: hypothetical protein R8G66_15640 [Cytophagales bacterium]|nr:hypothetical protein [Cytophagales bacterium]